MRTHLWEDSLTFLEPHLPSVLGKFALFGYRVVNKMIMNKLKQQVKGNLWRSLEEIFAFGA